MVLLDLQIYPNDKGVNLSEYVGRCLAVIDKSGITYKMHPMGTILEGEWEAVNTVVSDCFKALQQDCDRISVNIRVDYRAGDKSRLQSKIESVEKIVGKKLST